MLTTTNGVPYPENGDPISSYPATLQGMAAKIDAGGWVGRYAAAALSFPTGTWLRVTFDTEPAGDGDTPWPGPADGVTYSAGVFTVTKPGLWLISASVAMLAGATDAGSLRCILRASQGGAIGASGASERARSSAPIRPSRYISASVTLPVRLNLGAAFDVAAYQDTGAAQNIAVTTDRPTQLTAYRIAP